MKKNRLKVEEMTFEQCHDHLEGLGLAVLMDDTTPGLVSVMTICRSCGSQDSRATASSRLMAIRSVVRMSTRGKCVKCHFSSEHRQVAGRESSPGVRRQQYQVKLA